MATILQRKIISNSSTSSAESYRYLKRIWSPRGFWTMRLTVFTAWTAGLGVGFFSSWNQFFISNGVNAVRNVISDNLVQHRFHVRCWRFSTVKCQKLLNSMDQGNIMMPFSVAAKWFAAETAEMAGLGSGSGALWTWGVTSLVDGGFTSSARYLRGAPRNVVQTEFFAAAVCSAILATTLLFMKWDPVPWFIAGKVLRNTYYLVAEVWASRKAIREGGEPVSF